MLQVVTKAPRQAQMIEIDRGSLQSRFWVRNLGFKGENQRRILEYTLRKIRIILLFLFLYCQGFICDPALPHPDISLPSFPASLFLYSVGIKPGVCGWLLFNCYLMSVCVFRKVLAI